MDLLCVLAKGKSLIESSPMPSDIWHSRNKTDNRSGKQIMNDLIKGLGGE